MHRHITLVNGRAKAAEVYPDKLCEQIVIGLIDQMKDDQRIGMHHEGSVAAFDRDTHDAQEFWDDLSGKRLDTKLVRKAREE